MGNVRDCVYEAMADMEGRGFSYAQMQLAVMIVGNRMFDRQWKLPPSETMSESIIDDDTIPTEQSIKSMLTKVEAKSRAHLLRGTEELRKKDTG